MVKKKEEKAEEFSRKMTDALFKSQKKSHEILDLIYAEKDDLVLTMIMVTLKKNLEMMMSPENHSNPPMLKFVVENTEKALEKFAKPTWEDRRNKNEVVVDE